MRRDETIFIVDTAAGRMPGVEFFVVNDEQNLAERIPAAALSICVERDIDPPLISLDAARRIAEDVLDRGGGSEELRLIGPIVRPRHWVRGFDTVASLDGDRSPLAGQASIAFSKIEGTVRRLWRGRSIEDQL